MQTNNLIYDLSCLCHPERGVRYVGKTTQGTRARLAEHIKRAKNPHYPVNHWIAKHGAENIVMAVLEYVDADGLDAAEERWIAELRTFRDWKEGGLNASLGGKNMPLTAEKVKAIVLAARDSGSAKGVKLNWDTVRYIRDFYSTNDLGYSELAQELGLSITSIWQVVQNKTWKDESYAPPVAKKRPSASRGSGNKMFTKSQVRQIRNDYNSSQSTIPEIAKRWNCSGGTIQQIVSNSTYFDPGYVNERKGIITERQRKKMSRSTKGVKKPEGFGAKISAAMTGEGHSMAKLTELQVVEMLAKFAKGHTTKQLALEYGISITQARRIKTGERWGHLPR